MGKSLFWHCVWPILIGFGIASATALYSHSQSVEVQTSLATITKSRDALERGFARLYDRHNRFTNRVQEALLSNQPERLATTLRWAENNYPAEIDRAIANLNQLVATEFTKTEDPKIRSDLRRIEQTVSRIQESGVVITGVFETLIELTESDPPSETSVSVSTLFQNHRSIEASVQIALSTIRRSHTLALAHLHSHDSRFPLTWIPFFLWVPIALWLMNRPIQRLRNLVSPNPTVTPKANVEIEISQRLRQLRNDLENAETLITDRDTEALRSNQATRRAEHELALLRIYNENLVNNLRSAVVVSNLTGTVTSFNRAARRLFNLAENTPGPIDGLPFYRALLTRLPDFPAQLDSSTQTGSLLYSEALPVQLGGKDHLLDVSIVPYQDESGATRGFLWVTDDVTTSIHMKNQLIASEHLATVGRMSAQVAHEIRNPLSAIGLNAELLEEEFAQYLPTPQGEEAVKLLRAIEHEIERLTQITEGYLRLTKNPKPEYQTCDLNRSVTSLLTMLRAELTSKAIDLELSLQSPPPLAWADPGQIRQALINTIRNSVEAMPQGGTIAIQTQSQPTTCELIIRDTGTGIPKAVQPRIFEPFYTTKSNGTGLGLSLTKQIVTEHGGSIALEQSTPEGTTLAIRIPSSSTGGPPAS